MELSLVIVLIFGISSVVGALQNVTPQAGIPVCSLEGSQSAIYVAMKENEPIGSLVQTLPIKGRSDDSESGIAPDIRLRMVAGSKWFTLDTAKKQLRTAVVVDRDAGTNRLSAEVECESLTEDFKVNFTVHVTVQDINDNAPVFDKNEYHISLMEELPIGTTVFTDLRATDADQNGPKNQVSYEIVQDNEYSDLLYIPNPGEGAVVVNKRIDFESVQNFTLTVRAKDNWAPSMSSTAKLHVVVEDSDDLNPKFELDSYTAMVSPDLPTNKPLTVLPKTPKATDQDTLNADIVYSISGAHADRFVINQKTAEITLAGNLDPDENYLITLHAHQANRKEREAQSTLRILMTMTGSGSDKPRFSHNLFSADVQETAKIGSRILQVSAIDSDKTSMLLYSLKNPNDYPMFKLNEQTGVLSVASKLDHEAKSEYIMSVLATNGMQSAESMIEVKVVDVNDNKPEFNQPVYTFLPNGQSGLVGEVQASDVDGNEITYHLLTFQKIFRMDSNGRIRVRNSKLLTNMTYELAVMAEDNGNPPLHGHAVVRVDFSNVTQPLKFVVAGEGMMELGGEALILIIALAALSLLLLILCLVLLIYLCQRRKERKAAWRKAAQRPHIGSLLSTSNPPNTIPRNTISMPSSVYSHTNGLMLGNNGLSNHTTMGRSNGPLMSRYEDAVYPGDEASSMDMHQGTAVNVYGPADSPHGSQSPLHHDSHSSNGSSNESGSGYGRTNGVSNDCADRGMSISYRSGALTTEQLRMNTDLLVTDAVHPHMVNHHGSNGTVDVPSSEVEAAQQRSVKSNAIERPPLTVYF